jgi:hypothetical protein
VISRRYPDQAVVLCVSQDHACVHAKEVSKLVSPSPSQRLVDLFRLSGLAWRQARPSCVLLKHLRPEAFPVVENLLIEVSPVNFSVSGTAIPGVDYVPLLSPTYVGPSGYGVILVQTLPDPRASSIRRAYDVLVTLEPGAGYAVGEPKSAKMWIKP